MATQAAEAEQSRAVVPMTRERENYVILKDKAKMFALSPLIPDHLRAGGADVAAANCLIALQMAEAMGEMPLIVMQNIHVVKGKAGFAAQYMIARANASGVFKGRINWRVDRSDADNLSVTAFATLSDTGEEVEFTCDMKMAQAEGWTSNAKYRTMPEVMLRYRSATFLVRFYAPDVMLGYQTAEEVEDVVAAATPANATLTGDMLIAQARPTDDTAHDAETSEVIESEGEAEGQRADEAASPEAEETDELGVTQAEEPTADDIIDEIKACIAWTDVDTVLARNGAYIDALDEEMAESIRTIAEARKAEIKASRKGKDNKAELDLEPAK